MVSQERVLIKNNPECSTERQIKDTKGRIRDPENRIKQSNTCVIGVLDEEERKNDAEIIFKHITVEKFSVLVKGRQTPVHTFSKPNES